MKLQADFETSSQFDNRQNSGVEHEKNPGACYVYSVDRIFDRGRIMKQEKGPLVSLIEKYPRHRIKFPRAGGHELSQSEAYFFVEEDGEDVRYRFHDYDKIYRTPGLYEQIFYDRLKCKSPEKVGEILNSTLSANGHNINELRVLDLGAGNGIMGEVLKSYGVSRLIGADIIEEAKISADRDRPGVYDEYYVADFTALSDDQLAELEGWSIDCLTSVAALGFGDIPPGAFLPAMQLVNVGGWIAFNIKDTFLDKSDRSGFSRFIRELIFSEFIAVHHLERYRHRLSMEGQPLYYYALVAQKMHEIPTSFLDELNE